MESNGNVHEHILKKEAFPCNSATRLSPVTTPTRPITRVGDTFYLVNSSFEFFPGVPIRESKNLINWAFTGYVLDRESQLPLDGSRPSGGIFAPTIRYHDGMFYMITTNVNLMPTGHPNFIVHAEDPAGPWSEPAWISQVGIDPSVFFDDDGQLLVYRHR